MRLIFEIIYDNNSKIIGFNKLNPNSITKTKEYCIQNIGTNNMRLLFESQILTYLNI